MPKVVGCIFCLADLTWNNSCRSTKSNDRASSSSRFLWREWIWSILLLYKQMFLQSYILNKRSDDGIVWGENRTGNIFLEPFAYVPFQVYVTHCRFSMPVLPYKVGLLSNRQSISLAELFGDASTTRLIIETLKWASRANRIRYILSIIAMEWASRKGNIRWSAATRSIRRHKTWREDARVRI